MESTPAWKPLAESYHAHHFHCPTCIAAGQWRGLRCAVKDMKTVLTELRTGQRFTGTHHETFSMRREQAEAVNKTHAYFHSIWKDDMHAVPRFLWNAKMRFGKTFSAPLSSPGWASSISC